MRRSELPHCRRDTIRSVLVVAAVAGGLASHATAQSPPEGYTIISPAESVTLEHDDRKARLRRLSKDKHAVAPGFFEYVVGKADLKLAALPVDIPVLRVVFETKVFFDFDQDIVRPQAASVLDTVAASLRKEPPDVALFVAGHTDSIGEDDYNVKLGMRRALAVSEELIKRGIGAVRIYRVSFGEKVPVADNADVASRARNRRVEFLFAAHSEAIAFWLSRQATAICEAGHDRGCSFSADLVVSKKVIDGKPAGSSASLDPTTGQVEVRVRGQTAEATPQSREVTLQPKKYVIDLTTKKYSVPTAAR